MSYEILIFITNKAHTQYFAFVIQVHVLFTAGFSAVFNKAQLGNDYASVSTISIIKRVKAVEPLQWFLIFCEMGLIFMYILYWDFI